MKIILGFLGLVFVGLAMLDLGGVVANFPAPATLSYIVGLLFKGVIALVLLVFAFQNKPSGV